jgi:sensor domain CHASE-containing protein
MKYACFILLLCSCDALTTRESEEQRLQRKMEARINIIITQMHADCDSNLQHQRQAFLDSFVSKKKPHK